MASVCSRIITVAIGEERWDIRNVKEAQLREPHSSFVCDMVTGMEDANE